jgi:Insertion element 4 transposase N-terminal
VSDTATHQPRRARPGSGGARGSGPAAATAMVTTTSTVAAGVFAAGHLGELTQQVPFELVDAVLEQPRATQQRLRELPLRVGVVSGGQAVVRALADQRRDPADAQRRTHRLAAHPPRPRTDRVKPHLGPGQLTARPNRAAASESVEFSHRVSEPALVEHPPQLAQDAGPGRSETADRDAGVAGNLGVPAGDLAEHGLYEGTAARG